MTVYCAVPERSLSGSQITSGANPCLAVKNLDSSVPKTSIESVVVGQVSDFQLAATEYGADACYSYYVVGYCPRYNGEKVDLEDGRPVAYVPAHAHTVEQALQNLRMLDEA
ncbi:hypothetical protein KKF05_04460 [Patescibacteria group bacterium]|nr:hypothetical protein [Patescibacteria group bacterium]MBU1028586.1 hypothetical protein [Patescibacteria group bacterium]MBU1915496.1 hypothetical protein [Patescibacteria group bacterium]